MTNRRRTAALVLVGLLGLGAAGCGEDNSTKAENRTGATTVEPGDQRGSGSDGSTVENPPGNTPGGGDTADEPTGDNSGQDKP